MLKKHIPPLALLFTIFVEFDVWIMNNTSTSFVSMSYKRAPYQQAFRKNGRVTFVVSYTNNLLLKYLTGTILIIIFMTRIIQSMPMYTSWTFTIYRKGKKSNSIRLCRAALAWQYSLPVRPIYIICLWFSCLWSSQYSCVESIEITIKWMKMSKISLDINK